MVKYDNKYYRNVIVLDVSRIEELACILSKYCSCIDYSCKTKKDGRISFDSLDEVKQYSNFGDDSIASLIISGCGNNGKTTIDIEFAPAFPYKKYSVSCSYRFTETDDEALFVSEFEHYLKKCAESQVGFLLGKAICILFGLLIAVLSYFSWVKGVGHPKSLFSGVLLTLLLIFIATGWYWWFNWILGKLFPRVSYSIGEGEKKYSRLKALRSNLLWVVIIGAVITVIGGIIVK